MGGGRTTSTTVGRGRGKERRKEGRTGGVVESKKQGSSKKVRGGREGERLGSPPPLLAVLCNTVHFGFQILLLFNSEKTAESLKTKQKTLKGARDHPTPKSPAHLIVSYPRQCTFKTFQAHRLANPAPQKPPSPPPLDAKCLLQEGEGGGGGGRTHSRERACVFAGRKIKSRFFRSRGSDRNRLKRCPARVLRFRNRLDNR